MTEEKPKQEFSTLLDCYNYIVATIKSYIDIDEKYLPVLGCWVIGTYFHEWFQTYPYLFFNATRGGGKTRTLGLLSFLSKNGSMDVNLTEAVLFRKAAIKTAFFIDELERISSKEKANLRLLLNAAYKKGIGVERTRKNPKTEKYEIDRFEVFTPIAMANIWGLDDVLQDRCITVILEKSAKASITRMIELWRADKKLLSLKKALREFESSYNALIEKETSLFPKESDVYDVMLLPEILYSAFPVFWNILMSSLLSLEQVNNNNITSSQTSITSITSQTTYDDIIQNVDWLDMEKTPVELTKELCDLGRKIWESGIRGRNLELFLPLILIAHEIDTSIEDILFASAAGMTKEREIEDISDNKDTSLIAFLASYPQIEDWIKVKELTKEFKELEENEWINSKWIGRALKRLQLTKMKKHTNQGKMVIIDWPKVEQKARQLGIDVEAIKEEAQKSNQTQITGYEKERPDAQDHREALERWGE